MYNLVIEDKKEKKIFLVYESSKFQNLLSKFSEKVKTNIWQDFNFYLYDNSKKIINI